MTNRSRGRRILPWCLVAAAISVLGWVLLKDPAAPPASVPVETADGRAASHDSPALHGRGERPADDRRGAVGQGPGFGRPARAHGTDEATRATADDGGVPGAEATVVVVLDIPPAWYLGGPRVYALPAGAAGGQDYTSLPHAAVKGERTRLHLPASGSWDIGFVCASGWLLATDVELPTEEEVLLRAETAPIRFRAVGAHPGEAEGVHVRLRTPGDGNVDCPGRGQTRRLRAHAELDAAGRGATPALPAGVPFTLQTHDPKNVKGPVEWRPEPAVARAGDEVLIRAIPRGQLVVHLSLAEPMPQAWREGWKTDLWTAAYVVPPGAGEDAQRYESTYLRRDGTLKGDTLRFALATGAYEFHGGVGRAYHDDVRTVQIRSGEETHLDLDLVPDARHRQLGPGTVDWGYDVRLRIEGAAETDIRVFVSTREDGEKCSERHTLRATSEGPFQINSTNAPGLAQLFQPPHGVSEPFQLPARGTARVVLRRGGRLVVVLDVEPDESLGHLVLRRKDGAPLPFSSARDAGADGAGDLAMEAQVTLRTGLRLGPLLPGRHDFEVYLGGVRISAASAVVRAGLSTPLPISVRDRLRRR